MTDFAVTSIVSEKPAFRSKLILQDVADLEVDLPPPPRSRSRSSPPGCGRCPSGDPGRRKRPGHRSPAPSDPSAPGCVIVTVAPGSTPPVSSLTTPRSSPVVRPMFCARAVSAARPKTNARPPRNANPRANRSRGPLILVPAIALPPTWASLLRGERAARCRQPCWVDLPRAISQLMSPPGAAGFSWPPDLGPSQKEDLPASVRVCDASDEPGAIVTTAI